MPRKAIFRVLKCENIILIMLIIAETMSMSIIFGTPNFISQC